MNLLKELNENQTYAAVAKKRNLSKAGVKWLAQKEGIERKAVKKKVVKEYRYKRTYEKTFWVYFKK